MRREDLTDGEVAAEALAGEVVHFAERTAAPIPSLCGVELAPPPAGPAPLHSYTLADITCPACRSRLSAS